MGVVSMDNTGSGGILSPEVVSDCMRETVQIHLRMSRRYLLGAGASLVQACVT